MSIYAKVVLDYFETLEPAVEGPHGPLYVDENVLACIAETVKNLDELSQGNARSEVYQRMMAEMHLYVCLDLPGIQAFELFGVTDVIDAALKKKEWIYGGVFVLETMILAKNRLIDHGTFQSDLFNNWDVSFLDWTVASNSREDLSTDFFSRILEHGSIFDASDISINDYATYDDVWKIGSGYSVWLEGKNQDEAILDCPTVICSSGCHESDCKESWFMNETAAGPAWNQFSLNWGFHPLFANWANAWFAKVNSLYDGSVSSKSLALAIASLSNLSGENIGEKFAEELTFWFKNNDPANFATVESLVSSQEFQGWARQSVLSGIMT